MQKRSLLLPEKRQQTEDNRVQGEWERTKKTKAAECFKRKKILKYLQDTVNGVFKAAKEVRKSEVSLKVIFSDRINLIQH